MFRASVLLSFASLALALSASDLQVSVKAVASSVSSIEDIILTAVVTNPTDSELRITVADNILDDANTESFAVSKDGERVVFTGVRMTANLELDTNWVNIPAGQSLAVNHTVSKLYDFETHGTGSFTFKPSASFVSDITQPPVTIDVEPITVEVTEDVTFRPLFEREEIPAGVRQSTVNCGDGNRAQILRDSLADARARAGGAAYDIRANPNSVAYNRYFGGASHNDVWWRFDMIAGDLPSSGVRQVYCNQDPAGICNRASAYVLLYLSGGAITSSDVYICDSFYNFPNTRDVCGWDINNLGYTKGGVMLHELSHATAATTDVYYCGPVQQLSPAEKFNNADNYQCMALHIYRQYNC